MKQKSKLAIAVILSLSLIGCGGEEPPKAPQYLGAADYSDDVKSAVAPMMETEQQELAQILAELQKGDPSIRDAYYGVNDAGERVLHIVRNESPNYQPGQPPSENDSISETVWPLLAGAGAGMLLANMMNSSGGYGSYMNSHQPYDRYRYTERDRVVQRTVIVKKYTTNVYRNTSNTLKANPGFKPKSSADVLKTRPTASHATQTVQRPAFQQSKPATVTKPVTQTVQRPAFQSKPAQPVQRVNTPKPSFSKPSYSHTKSSYSRPSFSSSRRR